MWSAQGKPAWLQPRWTKGSQPAPTPGCIFPCCHEGTREASCAPAWGPVDEEPHAGRPWLRGVAMASPGLGDSAGLCFFVGSQLCPLTPASADITKPPGQQHGCPQHLSAHGPPLTIFAHSLPCSGPCKRNLGPEMQSCQTPGPRQAIGPAMSYWGNIYQRTRSEPRTLSFPI